MILLARFSFLLLVIGLISPAHAELKKWIDDDGQVHYGDTIPPRYLKQQHQVLNPQGVVIENVEAAKTVEELLEEKRQQRIALIKEKKRKQQEFKDRVLLDTYTTERDLIGARDERTTTIDSLIQLTQSIIDSNLEQLTRLNKRMEEFERFKKPVTDNMVEQKRILESQIKANQEYIVDQQSERERIVDTFNQDLERFRFLKQQELVRQADRERLRLERRKLEELIE